MSATAILEVSPSGWLDYAGQRFRCALGKGGVKTHKREGDGATPVGRFALRRLFYRPDRIARPFCALKTAPLPPDAGWCDDPAHPDYNRLVTLPHPASCETMWRRDAVYDLVIPLGYNDEPPVAGLGSAIFLHLARPDYTPTEGCVALARADFLALLPLLSAASEIAIGDPNSGSGS